MVQSNPSNPFTQDPGHTQKDVPLPVQKARVLAVPDHPDENGFHTVRVKVYGDSAPYDAPVLAPMPGCVWLPPEGSDVAVLFGNADKPWVIGSWYAVDRIENGMVDLPDYTPGDIRVGNHTGSHITMHNDGHISIVTNERERIDIDHQSMSAYLGTNQSIPGDNTYYQVEFDSEEDDPENMFDPTSHTATLRADGKYEIDATVEFQTPGQNNLYVIAIFVNDSLEKRRALQSAVNAPISPSLQLNKNLEEGDEIEVRIRHNRGSPSTIEGLQVSNAFDVQRHGI